MTGSNTAAPQNFMFNEGNSIKPYEPYTGGKPSPSPDYPQEIKSAGDSGSVVVKVTGKNLFYEQEFQEYFINSVGNTVGLATGNVSCVLQVVTGAKYYVTRNKIGTKFRVAVVDKLPTSGNPVTPSSSINADSKRQAEISATSKYMVIQCEDEAAFSELMVSLDSSTAYSPYREQPLTLPTPNGLPGIPVTSGGNYTDQNGQQWICDEIDLANGERVQWIGEYELTGKEKVADFGLKPRSRIASITIPDAYIDIGSHSFLKAVMSNKYKQTSFDEMKNNINLIARGQQRNICISIPTDIGIEDFKTDLSNQYASGHPAKVFYKLDTPIRTPLSPETIAAYKALRTYSPTPTVINDAGAGMSVGYAKMK